VTRPPWRAWTEEPWDATRNGALHRGGFLIGEMDEPSKADPGYASDVDVANAERAAAAVNALAGVRNPAAVPGALDALGRAWRALGHAAAALPAGDPAAEALRTELATLEEEVAHAVAALDADPADAGDR